MIAFGNLLREVPRVVLMSQFYSLARYIWMRSGDFERQGKRFLSQKLSFNCSTSNAEDQLIKLIFLLFLAPNMISDPKNRNLILLARNNKNEFSFIRFLSNRREILKIEVVGLEHFFKIQGRWCQKNVILNDFGCFVNESTCT